MARCKVSYGGAGYYAYHEITTVLDTSLATHAIGRLIMDKLSKCSRRPPNPTPPDGLKFGIQQNPMTPFKSIVWQRRAAAEADSQADTSPVEDVPYVLLYMTVRTSCALECMFTV